MVELNFGKLQNHSLHLKPLAWNHEATLAHTLSSEEGAPKDQPAKPLGTFWIRKVQNPAIRLQKAFCNVCEDFQSLNPLKQQVTI